MTKGIAAECRRPMARMLEKLLSLAAQRLYSHVGCPRWAMG